MIDSAKDSARTKAKVKRQQQVAENMHLREHLAAEVRAELFEKLGPFTDDAKGSYEMVCACQRKYGITPGDIVQQRLAAKQTS